MEMSGVQLIPAPQRVVWDALNDPEMLKASVPGCESIERTGDNEYQVQMVARVGPVSAKFKGKLTLSDVKAPDSYSIAFEGQGGPAGFAKGGAHVRLTPEAEKTKLSYDVKASVGGQAGDIGKMSGRFGTWRVLDTRKGPTGEGVLHILEPGAAPALGSTVELQLDWERRHRLMRLHTALHLLGAVVKAPVTGGRIGE